MLDRLPNVLLRLEGLALALAATIVYFHEGYGWILFAALALAPDVAFLGYAFDSRIGAFAYNTTHNQVVPLVLATASVVTDSQLGVRIALVWLVHVGVDRALGYGLKYPRAFRETHLQRA